MKVEYFINNKEKIACVFCKVIVFKNEREEDLKKQCNRPNLNENILLLDRNIA